MAETFHTSIAEMNRRKTAFRSLSISVFLSASVSSFAIFMPSPYTLLPCLIIFALLLLASALSTGKLLENSKRISVTVSDTLLERHFKNGSEKHPLAAIKGLRIKRTVKKSIREIKIDLSGSKSVYINGLDGFERFKTVLADAVRKELPITEIREPIDFDHPLFYPFFGTLTGTLSILALKFVLQLQTHHVQYLQLGIACFVTITGITWLFTKPISGRYGDKTLTGDYIWGSSMILAGIGIVLISEIF